MSFVLRCLSLPLSCADSPPFCGACRRFGENGFALIHALWMSSLFCSVFRFQDHVSAWRMPVIAMLNNVDKYLCVCLMHLS